MRKIAPWICLALCLSIVSPAASDALDALVFPEASGKTVIEEGPVTIDVSHANLGYIMVKHTGSDKRLKVRIKFDGAFQDYDLNGENRYEVYPLIGGSGSYSIIVAVNTEGDSYTQLVSKKIKVSMREEYSAFLVPNQYVWYEKSSKAVAKSFELCEGIESDWEKAETLYGFVSTTIKYDHMKALTVRKPYLPTVDDTLDTQMGICFDFAVLLAVMLRVQGIPAQLVIGDLLPMNQRHAWNKVFLGGAWVFMDPTFASSGFRQTEYAEDNFY